LQRAKQELIRVIEGLRPETNSSIVLIEHLRSSLGRQRVGTRNNTKQTRGDRFASNESRLGEANRNPWRVERGTQFSNDQLEAVFRPDRRQPRG